MQAPDGNLLPIAPKYDSPKYNRHIPNKSLVTSIACSWWPNGPEGKFQVSGLEFNRYFRDHGRTVTMNITRKEEIKKLEAHLNEGINALMMTRSHLASFEKDLEAAVVLQLKNAKFALKERKQRAQDAMLKISELLEAKQEETVEAVATWKVKRHQQKLMARAERAEAYAESCVILALYYAAESELALLEAISARQDAKGR